MQTLKCYYAIYIEPSLDAMSNGEATVFGIILTAMVTFTVWFFGKVIVGIFKKLYATHQKKKSVACVEDTKRGKQTEKTPSPPKTRVSPSSTQATQPLPHTSRTKLFGRKKELSMLTRAWHNDKQNIVVLKAMGGAGKTALLKTWIDGFNDASSRTPYDKIYTWSFYSQGSAEDKQASADEFFDRALRFFGYQGDTIASPHDKGIKLAELINQQRSLLILDGLEPLQYPIGIMHGDLKDKGLQALLQELAAHNLGLCLISSRQQVVELADKPLVVAHDLGQLETADGMALLTSFGCAGSKADLEQAVKDVKGHALTLILLGNYIKTVYQGDIRQRDKITDLTKEREEGKHAEKVMAAYESHLQGTTALSILYLMGLFDRPVSLGSIQHLRDAKIPQLTDQLGNETEWQYALADLRQQQLLNSNDPEHPDTFDTHPLIREYFGKRLQQSAPKVWQQAHALLYDYYKALPKKEQPDSLEEMEPLFAAIAHGCAAGRVQQALDEVYCLRIRRENDNYLCKKLGAFGADLSVLAYFFNQHWQTPAVELTDNDKALVFNWAAFRLQALGRLQEAVQPMQAGLEMYLKQENWKHAASAAGSLSELQLTQGAISLAIAAAQQSVELADKSGDWVQQMGKRTTLADAQHQVGELANAQQQFQQAEVLQQRWQAEYPQLYSLQGFRYCDWLLTAGQWQQVQQRAEQTYEYRHQSEYSLLSIALDQLSLGRASLQQAFANSTSPSHSQTGETDHDRGLKMVDSVKLNRPYRTIEVGTKGFWQQEDLAALQTAKNWLDKAVEGFRKAGAEEFIALTLLARAYYYRVCIYIGSDALASQQVGSAIDSGEAEASLPIREKAIKFALVDLNEAYEIAQRGGMLLHLTDYHLEAARLSFDMTQSFDPTRGALPVLVHGLSIKEHIEKVHLLIEKTGYKRRLPELACLQESLKTTEYIEEE